jgi:hypothetical protein
MILPLGINDIESGIDSLDLNRPVVQIEIDRSHRHEHISIRNSSDHKKYVTHDELRTYMNSLRDVMVDINMTVIGTKLQLESNKNDINSHFNEMKSELKSEIKTELESLKDVIKAQFDEFKKALERSQEVRSQNSQLNTQTEVISKLIDAITQLDASINNNKTENLVTKTKEKVD